MFSRVKNKVKHFIKMNITKDELHIARNQFKADNVKYQLRYRYPLTKDSIIFDVGGYTGDWAAKIIELYDPHVYIFEPIDEYYNKIVDRFANNEKVKVFKYGLDGKDTEEIIYLEGDASSAYRGKGEPVTIQIRSIDKVLTELGVHKIDLLKINNEGGEYGLLKKMIDMNQISLCGDLQIQFHEFFPNAHTLRDEIRSKLAITHELTYDYTFCFENWRKKKS